MQYEKDKHKIYYESLYRIVKEGKKKPSRANVGVEAGKDASSIKPGREMDKLITAIENAKKKFEEKQSKKTTIQKDKITKLNETILKLEIQLNESRARELLLLRKVRDLELELKRTSKPTLSDISMNLPDWTKK